jgi:hypothetical protein
MYYNLYYNNIQYYIYFEILLLILLLSLLLCSELLEMASEWDTLRSKHERLEALNKVEESENSNLDTTSTSISVLGAHHVDHSHHKDGGQIASSVASNNTSMIGGGKSTIVVNSKNNGMNSNNSSKLGKYNNLNAAMKSKKSKI